MGILYDRAKSTRGQKWPYGTLEGRYPVYRGDYCHLCGIGTPNAKEPYATSIPVSWKRNGWQPYFCGAVLGCVHQALVVEFACTILLFFDETYQALSKVLVNFLNFGDFNL